MHSTILVLTTSYRNAYSIDCHTATPFPPTPTTDITHCPHSGTFHRPATVACMCHTKRSDTKSQWNPKQLRGSCCGGKAYPKFTCCEHQVGTNGCIRVHIFVFRNDSNQIKIKTNSIGRVHRFGNVIAGTAKLLCF